MAHHKLWVTVGMAASLAALLAAGCGGDEGTGDPQSQTGGAAATGGSKATGGTSESTGGSVSPTGGSSAGGSPTGGSGGSVGTSTAIGAPCEADDDCGEGFLCLLPDFDGFPNGYCTVNVACATDADCQAVSPAGKCLIIDGTASICLEGCEPGLMMGTKCHDRPDTACTPLLSVSGLGACTDDSECGLDGVCGNDDQCREAVTACFPACGGDFDCSEGTFCDPGSGLCLDEAPVGLGLGEQCDPEMACPPDMPSEDCCQAICQTLTDADDMAVSSSCTQTCALGMLGCGWDGVAEAAPAACILPFFNEAAIGDLGFCVPLCDCDEQCLSATHGCLAFADFDLQDLGEALGRRGFCDYPIDTDGTPFTTIETCE